MTPFLVGLAIGIVAGSVITALVVLFWRKVVHLLNTWWL